MTRVASQRTRQALLVVGTEIDPFELPERWELYNLDGTPFDSIKDLSRLRWAGDWDAVKLYTRNDVVRHGGALYVAPEDIPAGTEPGLIAADPNVGTPNRGVQFKQSDRIQSITPRTIVIGDPPGQRRDNDISVGYSAAVLVDKTGATSGLDLIVTPLTATGSVGLTVGMYDAGMGLISVTNWTIAEVAAHTTKNIDVPDGSNDYYCHVFFGGGVDGSFEASVSSSVNLASPPTADISWEKLVAVLPDGGTTGQLLTKESGTDFDFAWDDPQVALPPGGATGTLLAKSSGADGDAGWVAPPHDLPVGGAMGYVLSKASSADRDVAWTAVPHELPAGGADTYLLAKNSASDYDVEWVPAPTGGASGGDPSVVIDDTFDGVMTPWTADAGSFTQDSTNGYLTPGSANSILRYNVTTFLDVLVAVEFEVLSGFTASAGFISLQVRRNTAGTHAVHVNLTTAGQGVLYKYHSSSFTAVTGANAFNGGSAVTAGKRYWGACYAHGYWLGMRGANHPLAIKRPINCDTINSVSGDSNFDPDAAGRVAIIAEQTQMRIHHVTIYDLSKTRSNG